MSRRHPADLIKSMDDDMFTAPGSTQKFPRDRVSGVYTHMTWATGGFVLGAICWHMVGFWNFVDRVLDEVKRPATQVAVTRNLPIEKTGPISPVRLVPAHSISRCAKISAPEDMTETDNLSCASANVTNVDAPNALIADLVQVSGLVDGTNLNDSQ